MNETGKEEAGVGPPAKRQRRPSVRLGDITPLVTLSCYNNNNIKPQPPSSKQQPQPQPQPQLKPKPQHPPPNTNTSTSTLNSFKRPLTNFTRIGEDDQDEEEGGEEDDDAIEEQDEDNQQQQQQHSPVSVDSGDEEEDVFQLPSRKSIRSADQSGLDHSVRCWLRELGLARYSPVFQIHEVDFHVLPLLTLDDLKDMGILAVGSRRKLYAAILNLRKGHPEAANTASPGKVSQRHN